MITLIAIVSPSSPLAAASLPQNTQNPEPRTADEPSPAPLKVVTKGPANIMTETAVQQGVFACVGRINQVTNYLGFDANAGGLVMTPPSDVDQRIVPMALAIPTDTGDAYVSVTFAPNQANGCGAVYDAVVYWQEGCADVASKQFATMKMTGLLHKDIKILEGGNSTKVFLMPAGAGCVSIKKEVVL